MTPNIETLERELAYIRGQLIEMRERKGSRAAGVRLDLREKERELLERIGKRLDGPP